MSIFDDVTLSKENESLDVWKKVMNVVEKEAVEFGSYFSFQLRNNIKHLLYTFSRYKFAVEMIGDAEKSVLELGCNEGIGTLFFAQNNNKVKAVDFDSEAILCAEKTLSFSRIEFECVDFMNKRFGDFDVVVSLDVIEHIRSEQENDFLRTILLNLGRNGFAIIGTPNIAASQYASEASRIGHINLYDQQRLKKLLLEGFENVFIFGMNDEVLHTGFPPMCHYIFALACNKKRAFEK